MKTYDEILTAMTEKYRNEAGFEPSAISDTGIKLRVLSGEIYGALMNCEWLKKQMFPDTASGEYLEKHARMRGITRRGAGFASGEGNISYIVKTRCSGNHQNRLHFKARIKYIIP